MPELFLNYFTLFLHFIKIIIKLLPYRISF